MTKKDTKKWLTAWEKAGIALKKIKQQELRDPDYYKKNVKTLDEMLNYACKHIKPRLTSGLVEQQRIFKFFLRNK